MHATDVCAAGGRPGFLGLRVRRHAIRVGPESLRKLVDQVRGRAHRGNPLSVYEAILRLDRYVRGWGARFGAQEFRELFWRIDPWMMHCHQLPMGPGIELV